MTLRLDTFGMRVANAEGKTLLDTIAPGTASGDALRAYGPLGATHHATELQISIIEGWDHVLGSDAPCVADPPADKEVYLRWTEFGALSSDMHDENACAGAPEGAKKWTLWSDAETTEVYGRYARLHTRLFPYLYATAKEAAATGVPVIRHPLLEHPSELGALDVDLEYYFGPSLYVAPVVRRGAVSRDLWLPPGTWFEGGRSRRSRAARR